MLENKQLARSEFDTQRDAVLNTWPTGEGVRIEDGVACHAEIAPDARLLAEITLASGFTSFEGGGISYNIPYTKKVPLEKSIADWQYVDRLVGIYEERGIRINREPFGPLTGTLVPPFVSHTIGLIEGLLALEQGVRSLTLGYGQAGNIVQDIAAIVSLKELAEEYLLKPDFEDAELTSVFHQWMGGFPEDESKAFAVIAWGSVVAGFAKAQKIIIKTQHEAMGIPTREANAHGLKATRQILSMLADQPLFETGQIRSEADMIKRETGDLMDAVFALGEGDIARGAVAAFEVGILDVPFAHSIYNNAQIIFGIGDDFIECIGPRTHVQRSGQIEDFRLIKEYKHNFITNEFMLVGVVGRKETAGYEDINEVGL